jgi:hypothetical protein
VIKEPPTVKQLFSEYVAKDSPDYTPQRVQEQIEEGKQIIHQIQNGSTNWGRLLQRKNDTTCIMLYLMYRAVAKNQGFNQGMFKVRDPGHALMKYILECGSPAVKPRISTHFNPQLLPSVLDGVESTTAYGINIDLPGKKRHVLFGPIKTLDGLDYTFFKPEDHGVDTWMEWTAHGMDYCVSKAKHWTGTANGPNDRKEHVLPEIRAIFDKIYEEVPVQKRALDKVTTFGIAAMKFVFEELLNDAEIADATKEKMKQFIADLHTKYQYDHVERRNGHEVVLDNSSIGPSMFQEQIRDAQMQIKYASTKKELEDAISVLKSFGPLTPLAVPNIVDELTASYRVNYGDTQSDFDSNKIFAEMNRHLQTGDVLAFTIDGRKASEFDSAATLFNHLLKKESIVSLPHVKERENAALRLMALLVSGPQKALNIPLRQWFAQDRQYLMVSESLKSDEVTQTIDVKTNPNPTMEVTNTYSLHCNGTTNPNPTMEVTKTYSLHCNGTTSPLWNNHKPYAIIEGKMSIDLHSQTAQISAQLK